jgi:hypothetical protein
VMMSRSPGGCAYTRLREIAQGASEALVNHFQVVIAAISALFGRRRCLTLFLQQITQLSNFLGISITVDISEGSGRWFAFI